MEENVVGKHEVRQIGTYKPSGKVKMTDFFSTITPDELMGEIYGYFTDLKGKVVVDPKKYKMTVVAKYTPKEDKEADAEMEDDDQNQEEGDFT